MTRPTGIGVVGCGGTAVDLVLAIDGLAHVHLAAACDGLRHRVAFDLRAAESC